MSKCRIVEKSSDGLFLILKRANYPPTSVRFSDRILVPKTTTYTAPSFVGPMNYVPVLGHLLALRLLRSLAQEKKAESDFYLQLENVPSL